MQWIIILVEILQQLIDQNIAFMNNGKLKKRTDYITFQILYIHTI